MLVFHMYFESMSYHSTGISIQPLRSFPDNNNGRVLTSIKNKTRGGEFCGLILHSTGSPLSSLKHSCFCSWLLSGNPVEAPGHPAEPQHHTHTPDPAVHRGTPAAPSTAVPQVTVEPGAAPRTPCEAKLPESVPDVFWPMISQKTCSCTYEDFRPRQQSTLGIDLTAWPVLQRTREPELKLL